MLFTLRFDFYEGLKDVQTLAVMTCLLAKQPLPELVQEFSKINKIEEEEKVSCFSRFHCSSFLFFIRYSFIIIFRNCLFFSNWPHTQTANYFEKTAFSNSWTNISLASNEVSYIFSYRKTKISRFKNKNIVPFNFKFNKKQIGCISNPFDF